MTVRNRTLRGHQPIELSQFNGLWRRGDAYDTPLDHFTDGENVKFIGTGSFGTRDGIGIHQSVAIPLANVLRLYNYPTQTANTILALVANGADGEIYHVVDATTVFGPILTITGMTDFAFVAYAGRAYISPFGTFTFGALNIEKGLEDEFLYVYLGAGAVARKAAGVSPTGTLVIGGGAAGNTDAGFKLFGVVFETDTGYLSPPGAIASFTTAAAQSVSFSSVPTSGTAYVVKRHIVATKTITGYNNDTLGYQFFFIPGAVINDDVTTVLANQSFFDSDLIDDASHLLDNFTEIPAGAALTIYNNRLCLGTTFDDISLVLVSSAGEPEAIDQVDGLLIYPLDGNPITNLQEMRDVLYAFKRNRTGSWVDNGDLPATWIFQPIDHAIGTPVHGIATVIDSGAASVDYFIVAGFNGIFLFNGRYAQPELSWKISAFWDGLDRDLFRQIQIVNDAVNQTIYIVLPDGRLLIGDYNNGLDIKSIRWMPWRFEFLVSSIALTNIDELIIGANPLIP